MGYQGGGISWSRISRTSVTASTCSFAMSQSPNLPLMALTIRSAMMELSGGIRFVRLFRLWRLFLA